MKSHGRHGSKWRRIRQHILEQSNVCWLCGQPGADTVDHVIPLSVAPELAHEPTNLRPAHRSCNSRKKDKVGYQPPHRPASRRW